MPFPWKKVRSTRLSRLVNDHLQNSQRRRGDSSLVVETGFPTSLVDLFMKNREKLKKPSKKKRAKNTGIHFDDSIDLVSRGPLPTSSTSSLRSSSSMHTPFPSPIHSRNLFEISVVDGDDVDTSGRGDQREIDVNRRFDENRGFVVVVKILMVVVLVVGMEKLTFGITILAFSLFLLEYVGKCGLLRPCSEGEERLRLMAQSFWRFLIDRTNASALRCKEESYNPICSGSIQDTQSVEPKQERRLSSSIQETQNVEPKRLWVPIEEEIKCEEMMDDSTHDGQLGCIELESMRAIMEREGNRLELRVRKSRRAKVKSKIKKFVAKKLRRSKELNSRTCEVSTITEDSSTAICEEQDTYEREDEIESENDMNRLSVSSGRNEQRDLVDAKCASDKLWETNEVRIEVGKDLRHLVLCVIVLFGLIGGRIFALMLALSWCLLLSSSETLHRFIKLTMIKSSSDRSS